MRENWLGRLAQGTVVAVLLFLVYFGVSRSIAEWHTRTPKPEGLEEALGWEPSNPALHLELAKYYERSSLQGDLNRAIGHYEEAARLDPHHARAWAALGGAYEMQAEPEKAQEAYEHAVRLFPNSPQVNWHLANFQIRQGRLSDAGKSLRKVMGASYPLRQQAFDLAWRAGMDPDMILAEIVPASGTASFHYLHYLSAKGHIEEANQTWERIITDGAPAQVKTAFPYLDALVRHGHVDELEAAWDVLAERNPARIRTRGLDANVMTNGDFEGPILNGGLDWRVRPVEGVVVRIDNLTHFDGTRSLKIRFDGEHNVNYRHIYQYVPVQPNTLYRFTGYLRTQEITTDSGLRFALQDALVPSRLLLSSDSVAGTISWTLQQLEFETGDETRLLVVRVVRVPSRKFDNKIAGTAWVDRVSLTPVE